MKRGPTLIAQPPRLSLARLPTPLHRFERFPFDVDAPRVWIKRDDLTGSALSGNKVRKLEYCLADALKLGCDTLITCGGTQSNLCRAVALAGAQLGLRVHLVLRGEPTDLVTGNLFLDKLAGATITWASAADYRTKIWPIMNSIGDEYAAQGHKAYAMGPGASNEVGLWGYLDAAAELRDDMVRLGIKHARVYLATGTTGTLAGLLLGTRIRSLNAEIVGISVGGSGALLATKVPKDFARWRDRYAPDADVDGLPVKILDGYAGPGYGKAEPHVLAQIAEVARTEGVLLDPVYTGKAFYAMTCELSKEPRCDDVIFLHTGGIFGLLAQPGEFQFDS